jgi:hypothetical protein
MVGIDMIRNKRIPLKPEGDITSPQVTSIVATNTNFIVVVGMT